jgi:hypothetical protein
MSMLRVDNKDLPVKPEQGVERRIALHIVDLSLTDKPIQVIPHPLSYFPSLLIPFVKYPGERVELPDP